MMEFDKQIEDMLYADEALRGRTRYGKYKIILVEEPWTMRESPWMVEWVGKVNKELCGVPLVQFPVYGDKYVLVTTQLEDGVVTNYVFLRDQYHSKEFE